MQALKGTIDIHKSYDYLKAQRLKRAQQTHPSSEAKVIDKLLKDTANLSEFEKMELLRRHADQIERRAQREEQLIKHNKQAASEVKSGTGIDRSLAVNDRYLDAINAKLKILD